jgi:hypothetical protein
VAVRAAPRRRASGLVQAAIDRLLLPLGEARAAV